MKITNINNDNNTLDNNNTMDNYNTMDNNNTMDKINDMKKKNNKRKRCGHDECNIKVGFVDLVCECGIKYCSKHRLPEYHNCNYNYKEKGIKNLKKELLYNKIENDKILNKL